MHPLSHLTLFLSLLFLLLATSTAALPATPATPTNPPPTSTSSPDTQQPPIQPFHPTTGAALFPTGIPASPRPNPNQSPAPSPIYSTLTPKFPPSNSSSSPGHHNSTSPCASGRPLRLGPARLHKNPHNRTSSSSSSSSPSLPPSTTAPTEAAVAAAAAIAAAAVETPADSGPRNYASLIPPAPGVTPRPEPNLAEMGYYQTTYYSCATRGTSTHCGWHRPIMVAPANNAAATAAVSRKAGIGALVVAAVVGVLVAG
ncbi:hypothetical protein BDP55DRAFT_632321 [Colletotrichum godetiae]|uniref:Uncharacterized protein n=1 Tax=Colletotrichum godetiae TaxID=1209918 RepID=A0AAJ0EXE4_9PEZI|nr:uncharacterized protein BDP55DRAFT_632321 [Colletotrichum godetiae]KAK1675145.1 hypothetical protein BDP55DRAFT_632321 [Colletotrichum godetiae]